MVPTLGITRWSFKNLFEANQLSLSVYGSLQKVALICMFFLKTH